MKKIAKKLLVFFLMFSPSFSFAACFVNGKEIPCAVFWREYGMFFSLCFFIPGLVIVLKPQWFLSFQAFFAKRIYDITFTYTDKTIFIMRIFGGLFALLGFIFLLTASRYF